MTFEAVPPGQAPSIIKPKVISSENFSTLQIMNARNGIIVNWSNIVTEIHAGFRKTDFISLNWSVIPIPNMTSPNNKGINDFKYIKRLGNKKLNIKKTRISKMNRDLYNLF